MKRYQETVIGRLGSKCVQPHNVSSKSEIFFGVDIVQQNIDNVETGEDGRGKI